MSEFPLYEAALLQAARRRYGWRRWRPRSAAALVTAAAAAVALLIARPAPQPDVEVPAATPISQHGVSTLLPPGWKLAATTLTPHLLDPAEVFTAATFAPVRRAAGCGNLPNVVMGAGDALVTVQEFARVIPLAPRPARFVYHPAAPAMVRMVQGCIPGAAVPSVDTFGLSGRAFTSIVVLGANATPAVRNQALEILDRLRAAAPAAPAAARGSG